MMSTPQQPLAASYERSDAELRQSYINAELKRQFDSYLIAHIVGLLCVSMALAFLEFHFALPELRYWSLSFRTAVVILALIAIPIFKDRNTTLRYVLFGIEQIVGLGSAMVLYRKYELGLPNQGYLAELLMVVQFNVLISVSPFIKLREIVWTGIFYGLVTAFVLANSQDNRLIFTIVCFGGYVATALVRISFMKILQLQHGIDYDLRRRLLPATLVRETLSVPRVNLAKSVRMRSTGILCIASDWRQFSDMSQRFDATDVVKVLSSYYDECVDLMHRHFPAGDCAIDWMADEFMIYVPYDSQNREAIKTVVESALSFSRDLMTVRDMFHTKYGYPQGIDIGIALGRASYGLSGTNNSRRMLAFGYPVSLARAIQHQVKRSAVSGQSQDFVTMTKDAIEALDSPHLVTRTAPSDRFLRQMGVEDIYVVDLTKTA